MMELPGTAGLMSQPMVDYFEFQSHIVLELDGTFRPDGKVDAEQPNSGRYPIRKEEDDYRRVEADGRHPTENKFCFQGLYEGI